jgi:hypothetical protein
MLKIELTIDAQQLIESARASFLLVCMFLNYSNFDIVISQMIN